MHIAATQNINSFRRCLSTTLTLSAAALSASAAHGAVIVTDFADLTVNARGRAYVYFNPITGSATASTNQPNDNSGWEFRASYYYEVPGKSGWDSAVVYGNTQPLNKLAASPLLPGSTMDNTVVLFDEILPPPSNLTDAYIGVRFLADIATSNYQYGWIKISTGPNTGGQGPTSITMHAAALETTPNTGITIPSAVPEPSSALLLGLVLGAGAFSRRRSQAA